VPPECAPQEPAWPLPPLEAAACGLPIVVTAGGATLINFER
jgi:glycosyltransferase involved in cell wall biosynthesis